MQIARASKTRSGHKLQIFGSTVASENRKNLPPKTPLQAYHINYPPITCAIIAGQGGITAQVNSGRYPSFSLRSTKFTALSPNTKACVFVRNANLQSPNCNHSPTFGSIAQVTWRLQQRTKHQRSQLPRLCLRDATSLPRSDVRENRACLLRQMSGR